MNKTDTLQMIAELSDEFGVCGFEDRVVAAFAKYAMHLGDSREDSIRNFYLYRRDNTGKRPVVLLDAHSDEVGFMVQAIRPNGTLQIISLGSWITHNIPAHKVWVRNGEGEYIPGIIASKPPHYMSEQETKAALEMKQITVDVGAVSKEDAIQNFKIHIGAPIVPNAVFEYIDQHDLMIGKAFDNRLGCAAIFSILQELKEEKLQVDVIATITSQEEVGTRGSIVATQQVKPDIAIVLEGSPADDTFVDGYEVQTVMKKGPMLRHIDAKMITNPRFQRYALDLCKEKNIPVQESVRVAGSTNSASIHISNHGVPTIVIGIPVRYAHTHYGIASYSDYEHGVKLAGEIIRNINTNIIRQF